MFFNLLFAQQTVDRIVIYNRGVLLEDTTVKNFIEKSINIKAGEEVNNAKIDSIAEKLALTDTCRNVSAVLKETEGVNILEIHVDFALNPINISIENNVLGSNLVFNKDFLSNYFNSYYRYWFPGVQYRIYDEIEKYLTYDLPVSNLSIRLSENKKNDVLNLHYVIEGEILKINSITILGNKQLNDHHILSVLKERENISYYDTFEYELFDSHLMNLLALSNAYATNDLVQKYTFTENKMHTISETVSSVYSNLGYRNVKVKTLYEKKGDLVDLIVLIEENKRYKVGELEIRCDDPRIDLVAIKNNISHLSNSYLDEINIMAIESAIGEDYKYTLSLANTSDFSPVINITRRDKEILYDINFESSVPMNEIYLREYMGVEIGQRISSETIDKIKKKLKELKIFEEVEIRKEKPQKENYRKGFCILSIKVKCVKQIQSDGVRLFQGKTQFNQFYENFDPTLNFHGRNIFHINSIPVKTTFNFDKKLLSLEDITFSTKFNHKSSELGIAYEYDNGKSNKSISYSQKILPNLKINVKGKQKLKNSSKLDSELSLNYDNKSSQFICTFFHVFKGKDDDRLIKFDYIVALPNIKVCGRHTNLTHSYEIAKDGSLTLTSALSFAINQFMQLNFAVVLKKKVFQLDFSFVLNSKINADISYFSFAMQDGKKQITLFHKTIIQ